MKKRQTNFELLRIVAMLMIVTLHFNLFGEVLNNVEIYSFNWYFFNILEFVCIIAVNLYVLITGYFMVKSKFKLSKVLKLELQVIFYTVSIYLVLVAANKIEFNTSHFVKLFLPVTTCQYWFVTAYMILYLLSPIINILINAMSQKQYKYLLTILFISLSCMFTIYPQNTALGTASGYSVIRFIFLYLFAGYIRIYKQDKKLSSIKLLIIFVVSVIAQISIKVALTKIKGVNIVDDYSRNLISYNNVIVFIQSVSIFLLFKNINIENKITNKCIMFFSSSTFAVYLIHEQPDFIKILWESIKPYSYLGTKNIYLVWITSVFGIFVCSVLIDKVRILIFKLFAKMKWIGVLKDKLDGVKIEEDKLKK